MDSYDSSESVGGAISSTLGLGTTGFMLGCSEAVVDNYSGTGFVEIGEETSAGTDSAMDAADGNTPALTTVFGLISTFSGSSSGGGEILRIWVRSENKKTYSAVEQKAKEIYDEYNKSHIKEKEHGTTLLAESPEVAKAVRDIVSNAKSKYELIHQLELLEQIILENNSNQKGKQLSLKKEK